MGRGFLSGIFWSGVFLFGGLVAVSLFGPPPQGPVPVVNSAAPDAAVAPNGQAGVSGAGDAGGGLSRPDPNGATPDAGGMAGGTPGRGSAPVAPVPGELDGVNTIAQSDAGDRPGAATDVTAPGGRLPDGGTAGAAGQGSGVATLGSDAPALPPTAAEAPLTPGTDQMPTLERTLDRPVTAEVAAEAPDQPQLTDPATQAGGPAGARNALDDAPKLARGPDTLASATDRSPDGPVVDTTGAPPQAGASDDMAIARPGAQDRPALPRQTTRPEGRNTPEGAGEAIALPPQDAAPGRVASPAPAPADLRRTSEDGTPPAAEERPMLADGDDSNDPEMAEFSGPETATETGSETGDTTASRQQARPAPAAGVTAEYAPSDEPRPVARPDDLGVTARLAATAKAGTAPVPDDAAAAPEPLSAPAEVPDRSPLARAPQAAQPLGEGRRTATVTPRIIRPGGARPLLQGEAQAARAAAEAARKAAEAEGAPGLIVPGPDAARDGNIRPVDRFAVRHDDSAARPLMSVVLIDVPGESLTAAQLKALTFPVTFAIDPSRADAARVAATYRAAGHEVLMLASTLARTRNANAAAEILDSYAARLPEAVGLMDIQSSGIQGDRALQSRVIDLLSERGYGFVLYERGLNSAAAAARREGVPTGLIFRMIDEGRERAEVIRRYLDRAAFKANKDGSVVMVGHTYAETVQGLVGWALDGRAAALSLAPVTAILLQGDGERG